MSKKKSFILYLCIAIFGILGVYMTFFAGNISKFDSQTKAYRIEPNEDDSGDSITYTPTYYFSVDGQEYECRTKAGSSSYPKESKNTVYYDSKNLENCKTEYEKRASRVGGIICLVATAIMVYFFIIKKPSSYEEPDLNEYESMDPEREQEMSEQAEKAMAIINKVQLIYKRIILGIVIIILLVVVLIDTALFKQTLKAKNFIETTATYVDRTTPEDGSDFDDCTYVFTDKQGNTHEVVISLYKGSSAKDEIMVKYNEKDPEDYYEEDALLSKKRMTWYIVKIVAIILLIALFFNKELLNKLNLSTGVSKN